MMTTTTYGNNTFKHDLALAVVPAVISLLLQSALEHWRERNQQKEQELSPEEEAKLDEEATEGLRRMIREEVQGAVEESFKSYTRRVKNKNSRLACKSHRK